MGTVIESGYSEGWLVGVWFCEFETKFWICDSA